MKITLNGKESANLEDSLSVTALLDRLGMCGQAVLVELDGEPIHRRDFGTTTIAEGATVEIIRIAAGG